MTDQENLNNQEAKLKKPGEALVGKVLFDRFEVLEVLGESAMALVLKAREVKSDRLVAIKTVTPHDPDSVRRFAQEVQLHGSLKHVNIVEAIDSLEAAGGRTFFIMEFLSGESLHRVLQTQTRLDNENELASILIQVCDALAHAHQFGVLHRDLKPGNIFLLEKDNQLNVKVLDFGIAKPIGQQTGLTQAGYAVGSPLYMSPEQCRGHQVDTRSDVYSLGILAYEMTTGHLPYGGHNIMTVMAAHCDPDRKPPHLNTHVPELRCIDKLNETIQTAMETDPAKRFQTINDFKNSVQMWHDAVKKEFLSTLVPGQPRNVLPDTKTAVAEQVSRSAGTSTTDSAPKVPVSESLQPAPDDGAPDQPVQQQQQQVPPQPEQQMQEQKPAEHERQQQQLQMPQQQEQQTRQHHQQSLQEQQKQANLQQQQQRYNLQPLPPKTESQEKEQPEQQQPDQTQQQQQQDLQQNQPLEQQQRNLQQQQQQQQQYEQKRDLRQQQQLEQEQRDLQHQKQLDQQRDFKQQQNLEQQRELQQQQLEQQKRDLQQQQQLEQQQELKQKQHQEAIQSQKLARQQGQQDLQQQHQFPQQQSPATAPNKVPYQPAELSELDDDDENYENDVRMHSPQSIEQASLSANDQKSRLRTRLSIGDDDDDGDSQRSKSNSRVVIVTVIIVMILLLVALLVLAWFLLRQ